MLRELSAQIQMDCWILRRKLKTYPARKFEKGNRMNASEVIKRLNQMKTAADSEEDSAVLNEALKLISGKEQYKIAVP